ncbi:hypothetical protein Tco_1158113, partial [Tanacetum coccineum]
VMAAPVISISSDTSEESVGSHAPRVILFGAIPAIIPVIPEVPIVPVDAVVTPEVGAVSVVSPFGVLDLVDYSPSSDSDPSEDSLPPAPDLPLVSPFLCSDDSKADGESEPAEQRPVSSSHDTLAPLSEFPLAPVVVPPGIRRWPTILVRPDEAIPFGRLYLTYLNGLRKLLTARKRVKPILAHRFAWRRVSHHSPDRHSSPTHLLLVHLQIIPYPDIHHQTPPMLIHLHHIDLFIDHLLGLHDIVRLLDVEAPTPTDLLLPRKRFRDSYSPEDSGEEHMEVDTANAEAIADEGISERVVAHPEDGVGIGFEIADSDVKEDDEEFEVEASAADTREIAVDPFFIGDSFESSRGGIPDLEDTIYDIVHYISEVRIDRITEIETTQRQLEASHLVASRERANLVKRIGSLRLEYLKVRAMFSIER